MGALTISGVLVSWRRRVFVNLLAGGGVGVLRFGDADDCCLLGSFGETSGRGMRDTRSLGGAVATWGFVFRDMGGGEA